MFIFPIPKERIQNPAEPALSGIELGPKIIAGPDKFTDIVSFRYLILLPTWSKARTITRTSASMLTSSKSGIISRLVGTGSATNCLLIANFLSIKPLILMGYYNLVYQNGETI